MQQENFALLERVEQFWKVVLDNVQLPPGPEGRGEVPAAELTADTHIPNIVHLFGWASASGCKQTQRRII